VRSTPPLIPRALALSAALPLLLAAGCASTDGGSAASPRTSEAPSSTEPTEVGSSAPRLALTYDGGVQVVDAQTLEVLADEDLDGFNRLNPAGDGRHFLVSTSGGFQLLDGGAWGEPHGDHAHHYVADPELTDVVFEAEKPGHVVAHAGRTVLFDDGTGAVTAFDSSELADPDRETREHRTPTAHHGVALELEDGTMLVSEGTEDARTGVRLLDAEDREIAASDECPGVHGETVAGEDTIVIGCSDGVLVVADGAITKVPSPDPYGRIGNQAGSEVSPIVLGDYKSDPDAELERPTRVALVDTTTMQLRLVDLPSSYWYRSLGRGEDGEALVLGTDGALHVIDPIAGTVIRSMPVIAPWEESEDWQDPHPQLVVLDGTAYITEPATNSLHAVDIATGEVWETTRLDVTPNELAGVSGDVDEHPTHEHPEEHEDEGHGQ
jgi:outer membrane protein assembly factor BamB